MSKQIAHWILIVPALILATALPPETALADGTTAIFQTDLEYIYSDIDREVKATGEESESKFSYFRQIYNLELQNQLYPYLRVRGGGHLDMIDSSNDTDSSIPANDFESDFRQTTWRGFADLDITNPLHTAGAFYRYREFKFDPSDFASTKIKRVEYGGLYKWRPVDLPAVDLDYSHFRTWDEDETRDLIFNLVVLKSRYSYQELFTDYTYTRNDRHDLILDDGNLSQLHNGGILYGTDVLHDRVEIKTSARLNYDRIDPSGSGDIVTPTGSPGAPFYLTDDRDPTTLTVVDAANPLTNINIGRNGPLNPVAVGLDFGPPTEVDTIYVLPQEDASDPTLASPGEIAAVAGGFVWTVYSSDDQQNWTQLGNVSATYNLFDNRFEISFRPAAETPFIKVVTNPLTNASAEIRIEAIQAFTTSPGAPGEARKTITQIYNLGLTWNATNRTTATFQSFARIRDNQFIDTRKTTLTNGVSVQHEFTPIFYGDARVLRLDTLYTDRLNATRLNYTASIGADYFPTFQQRLIYSGQHEEIGGDTGYQNSIFLRTNADLYRDWSVNLDVGYAANNPSFGPDNSSTSFRAATTIAPNPKVTFSVDYFGSWDTEEGRESTYNQIAKFQAFWVPIRTLSLFAVINLRNDQRNREGLNVVQNYSINWAAIPDGTLDLNLAYNQKIDTRGTESKILSPQLKWQMTRTTLLTLTYEYGTIETEMDIRDIMALRVDFRLLY